MTVAELIVELQKYRADTVVRIETLDDSYDIGEIFKDGKYVKLDVCEIEDEDEDEGEADD